MLKLSAKCLGQMHSIGRDTWKRQLNRNGKNSTLISNNNTFQAQNNTKLINKETFMMSMKFISTIPPPSTTPPPPPPSITNTEKKTSSKTTNSKPKRQYTKKNLPSNTNSSIVEIPDGPPSLILKSENSDLMISSLLTDEQRKIVELILKGNSVFITGAAGTGKSFLLRQIIQLLRVQHGNESVYVCASTGVAAVNVSGITLHTFAGVALGNAPVEQLIDNISKSKHAKQRWKKTKVLIIDEISMIQADFMDVLDQVAKAIRKNDAPFGGIQVVLCGDFLQLPPVINKHNEILYFHRSSNNSNRKFCFESDFWKKGIQYNVSLTRIFRQADPHFARMLNEVRIGRPSAETIQDLSGRVFTTTNHSQNKFADSIQPTLLHCKKIDVDEENAAKLHQLQTPIQTFVAEEFEKVKNSPFLQLLERNCPAPKHLVLKEGAQVMLLRNIDVQAGLCNGARGVVVGFAPVEAGKKSSGCPIVKFASGQQRTITPEAWTIEIGGKLMASRKQVPLSLAWALSVHKSQGVTLDRAVIDLKHSFESGMVYVALSRVSSLSGLFLKSFDPTKIKADPKVLDFYKNLVVYDEKPSVTVVTSNNTNGNNNSQQVLQ